MTLVFGTVIGCSPGWTAPEEKVLWRLEIDSFGSFVVVQQGFPIARHTLVSSTTAGQHLTRTTPEDRPWDARCAWNYGQYFAWASSLDVAWRADWLSEQEWTATLLGSSQEPFGHACGGPTEWWSTYDAAWKHSAGAEFTCEHAAAAGPSRARCVLALSHRAAALDFTTMLAKEWRIGDLEPRLAPSNIYYSEQTTATDS